MSSKPLGMIHLSDLHICDKDFDYISSAHGIAGFLFGGPALLTDFPRLRKAIEAKAEGMDWMIISGDITHTGRLVDLREAREFVFNIEGDFTGKAEAMRSVALIPGNHDRYEDKGPKPGNVGPFESKFNKFWNIGQGVQFRTLSEDLGVKAGFADFSLRKKDYVALPATPSLSELREWLELWGNGCVYEDVLEDLSSESAKHIADGWHVVWVIHFAPFHPRLREDDWKLRLRNQERLISRAREVGVRHIFCGHTHKQDHYECNEVEIFCAGQSLRDSRFASAHFFVVKLAVSEQGLVTQSWESVVRSVGRRNRGIGKD